MSAKSQRSGPAREVIAPPHISLRKEVGREAGPPPLEYGEVRLWLVAKSSRELFSYWEFRPEEHPEAVGADGRAQFFLRLIRESGEVESTTQIEPAAGNWTIEARESEASYHTELGFFNAKGVWCFLARSSAARTGLAEAILHAPAPTANGASAAQAATESPPPGTRWTAAQERHLNRILAAEVARHRPPRVPREPRGRSKSRGPKK